MTRKALLLLHLNAATRAGDQARLIFIPGVGHFEIASPRASTWPQVDSVIKALLQPGVIEKVLGQNYMRFAKGIWGA